MIESGAGMDAGLDIKQRMIDTYKVKFQQGNNQRESNRVNLEDIDIDPHHIFFGGLTGITNTMLMFNSDLDDEEIADSHGLPNQRNREK